MQQYNDIIIDVLLQKNSKEEQRWVLEELSQNPD